MNAAADGRSPSASAKEKTLALSLVVAISKLFHGKVFEVLKRYCRGVVLDIGGRDFFLRIRDRGFAFERWTSLELDRTKLLQLDDSRFDCVHGDGCDMRFDDNQYDTVLSLQVLEHVFEPARMVSEMGRVLKPGGHAILLVPQTLDLHLAPTHYQNFTRHWIMMALERAHLEVVEIHALGGVWRTIASRLFLFTYHCFRVEGWSMPDIKRPPLFYPLLPLMFVYALVGIPICLLLSLGDLKEEANNHLVVARKPAG